MTKMEEPIARLIESQASIQKDIRPLTLQFTALKGGFEQSIRNQTSTAHNTAANSVLQSNRQQQSHDNQNYHPPCALKSDVPRFDGTDSLGWIFKATQFFDFHHIPDSQRITISSSYMDGIALSWFQWMHHNGKLTSWNELFDG